jgi:hypothetical protein
MITTEVFEFKEYLKDVVENDTGSLERLEEILGYDSGNFEDQQISFDEVVSVVFKTPTENARVLQDFLWYFADKVVKFLGLNRRAS